MQISKVRSAGKLIAVCAVAATAIVPLRAQQVGELVLHTFAAPADGANPYAGVVRDSAGNLYGTTNYGGAANKGVVYKVDPAGQLTLLHAFTGGEDGGLPKGGVILDEAGNLYGTTMVGGDQDKGVVFKIDPSGHETVLHTFQGEPDGAYPESPLVRDFTGNFYGTTTYGGTTRSGVVFKVDPQGHLTVFYSFQDTVDGGEPVSAVTLDPEGNLYGTTSLGGDYNYGVIYKLDPAGRETTLYNYVSGPVTAGVTRDPQGNLYGTNCGSNIVYKLDSAGQYTVLHGFNDPAGGGGPCSGLLRDSAGNLYGTTIGGGGATSAGVVYKLDPAGRETVLYTFTGNADGNQPWSGVVSDGQGHLYGTTYAGGPGGFGVVYELDSRGHESVLYGFNGASADGRLPNNVIRDAAGNLYGTTMNGGTFNAGVIFRLDAQNRETVLYNFTGGADGGYPHAGVILDAEGNLYGTTPNGGSANWGVIYKLDTTGKETVLYNFTGGVNGGAPYAGVVLDAAGNFFGTTSFGGTADLGTVYKLDPAGYLTILHSFTGGVADGNQPSAGVILDAAGNLYGTTPFGGAQYGSGPGVVYKIDPAGQETVFTNGLAGGVQPYGGLVMDSAGNLYGTTCGGGVLAGGTPGVGVVYKLDPTGQSTALYVFQNGADGGCPDDSLVLDSAGNLYGTAVGGGDTLLKRGVVFQLTPSGQETVLYNFHGGDDGGQPSTSVVLDPAGNLYGTTMYGGKTKAGVLFKLDRNVGKN